MDSIFHEKQPSGNMDDSGFFSIQVISNALRVWGLELILFNSREYQSLMINPILHLQLQGFFILFSFQWFNLNSLLTGPELISDTYLALFLAQLQQEGYSIFVIRGNLPECEAEQILGIMRVQQQQRPRLIGEEEAQTSSGYVCVACVVWRTQEMLIKESHTFCFVLLKRNL
uniref:ubiquitinyl hydrolase 1 n=1 Tax=Haplochromis burtoni TaxID=8153 RepID=A0A3Q2X377_HAPBU